MTPTDRELSCYVTHLLLEFARRKKLTGATAGVTVPLEKLDNPHEWTDTAVWTKIAENIENELGGAPGIFVEATCDIYKNDTPNFLPLLMKIAPMRVIQRTITKFCQNYSNKNVHLSFSPAGKNRWLYKVSRITPGHFSRQMCDFHKGAVIGLLSLRGYRDIKVTEIACAPRNGAPACEYVVEAQNPDSFLNRVKKNLQYRFRDRSAIMRFMEQNHQELQKQYREILSMRDFYSHIMDSMGESIVWLNADTRIDFTNKAFCTLAGIAETDIKGRLFAELLSSSDSGPAFSALCDTCRTTPGAPHEIEFTFASAGASNRIGQTSVIWVTSEHYQPGYVISIRDITDKRKIERQLTAAEVRYRSLYENSPALIVAVNLAGNFIYANPAMTDQSGYTEDELKTMHFKDLIAPQAEFDVDRLLRNLFDQPTRLQEVHFKTKYGTWKCIALNTYHIHDADGTLSGIAGIGVDITETKRLNEQIIKSQRMDLLGQLAGGLAHDFGNILTSINGFSKLIASKSTDEKIAGYAEAIARSGMRAHDLVKSLLAFSRGDARRSVVFDVNSIVLEVKEMMFGAAPKSITIITELPDDPLYILGDPGNIHQCILNLCINARDAIGPHNSGTITIRALRTGTDNSMVQVQVADTGSGIPPDIIEKIFDPFFSTKQKKEGTGLGLSVVYGIMKSHKGQIHVESHPGEGALFTLEFPAAQQPLMQ
jgi:PAS domain S-box-containing protein